MNLRAGIHQFTSQASMLIGQPTNHTAKAGDGGIGKKDKRYHHRPVLVGHKLSKSNIEAELDRLAQAKYRSADNEHIDRRRPCAYNDADKGHNVSADEKPPSSEEIRQTPQNGIGKGKGQRAGNVEPSGVVAGTNVIVDVRQNVGRQEDEGVCADGCKNKSLFRVRQLMARHVMAFRLTKRLPINPME